MKVWMCRRMWLSSCGPAGELGGRPVHLGPPKTEAGRRTVTLPAVAATALAEHLSTYSEPGPDGLVSTSFEGGLLRRSNFHRRVWRPATRAVGVDGLRFHDLRHTSATLSIAAALDQLIEAASALGKRPPSAPSSTRVARIGQPSNAKKRR